MDAPRFDSLVRGIGARIPRRGGLRIALGVAAAAVAPHDLTRNRPPVTLARKKRKKPLQFNEFGCLDVGSPCRGKDELCCSGICGGKKPKRGKRDRRRCAAHDQDVCTATNRQCAAGPCTTSVGRAGGCVTTTGSGSYCADFIVGFPCAKDADCVQFCGPLAACILCPPIANDPTGGRHCAGPGDCQVP